MDTMDTWHGCGLVVEVLRKQRICFIVHCPVLRGEGGMSLGAKKIFWTLQCDAACMKCKAPLCINCISPPLLSLGSGCRADPGLAAQRVTAGSWQSKDPPSNSNQARSHFFILAIADQSWGAGNIFNWGMHVGVGGYCFISRKVLDYFIELCEKSKELCSRMIRSPDVEKFWESAFVNLEDFKRQLLHISVRSRMNRKNVSQLHPMKEEMDVMRKVFYFSFQSKG